MNDLEKAFLRDINRNPAFASICEQLKLKQKATGWRKGKDPMQWAYDSGYSDAIEIVLNSLRYDHD